MKPVVQDGISVFCFDQICAQLLKRRQWMEKHNKCDFFSCFIGSDWGIVSTYILFWTLILLVFGSLFMCDSSLPIVYCFICSTLGCQRLSFNELLYFCPELWNSVHPQSQGRRFITWMGIQMLKDSSANASVSKSYGLVMQTWNSARPEHASEAADTHQRWWGRWWKPWNPGPVNSLDASNSDNHSH